MTESSDKVQDEAVICPACGHDNISGIDTCEGCGQSLSEAYITSVDSENQLGIFSEPLKVLKPHQPECVARNTPVSEVIARLKGKNIGCVLVTGEEGQLVGIFTERDVLYQVAGLIKGLDNIMVESLMTPDPTALKASVAISHALHLMGLHGFRHVPLVDDDGRPVGFISFRDIVRFIELNFTSEPAIP